MSARPKSCAKAPACCSIATADPIKIGRLQRYATDHVYENRIPVLRPAARKSGKRVAIIGGGPAGLGCAAELAQLGHEAVIFERKPNAGGLNTYGIAYYKMKPQVSLEEVELVRSLGVEIRCGAGSRPGRHARRPETSSTRSSSASGWAMDRGSGFPGTTCPRSSMLCISSSKSIPNRCRRFRSVRASP